MIENNKKIEFVKNTIGTRQDYSEITTKYNFSDTEKDILLQATANIIHSSIDKLLIYEAYEILAPKIKNNSVNTEREFSKDISSTNQNISPKSYKKKEKVQFVSLWKQDGLILLLIGIVLVVSIFVTYNNNKEENERISQRKAKEKADVKARHFREGDVHGAWAYMQIFVKQQLKSPKSADFPFGGYRHVTDLGGGEYKVNSYVDSKNAFNATIRTHFNGVIKRKNGKWVLEYLNFAN